MTDGVDRALRVGLIGGSSQVGRVVINRLVDRGAEIFAFSRNSSAQPQQGVTWLPTDAGHDRIAGVPFWLSVAPAYALPPYLERLRLAGARRLVVLSSTSLLTKQGSPSPKEQEIVRGLEAAEAAAWQWAERTGAELCVLRPTLIYGHGLDRNVAEIARFIRRFGLFPMLGAASGLRQPVHVDDVAEAALAALLDGRGAGMTLTLAGGEALPYREMVERIFAGLGRRPLLLNVPLGAFRLAVAGMRLLPRYRAWTPEMAERMNRDQAFDSSEAEAVLGVSFRPFNPSGEDVRPPA